MDSKLPNLEEYHDAAKIVNNHKICDGCNQLFNVKDVQRTIYWGIIKFWCKICYPKVKDDD